MMVIAATSGDGDGGVASGVSVGGVPGRCGCASDAAGGSEDGGCGCE